MKSNRLEINIILFRLKRRPDMNTATIDITKRKASIISDKSLGMINAKDQPKNRIKTCIWSSLELSFNLGLNA